MKTALERGEQALLFLNRRGYAPLTLCRACGFRLACPNCDAWLVDHRFKRRLVCHHCGFAMPPPAAVPEMPGDGLASSPCGPGVERLEEEAAELFPDARILVLSSDLVAIDRAACARSSTTIAQGRVDIVIGTQLVAKGHHFPKLNLVGVVDADLGLANGDPRAAERTFQLLHQVVGRAGREEGRGIGYLQTHQPEHPVMQRADRAGPRGVLRHRDRGARSARTIRRSAGSRACSISGADKHATEGYARKLAAAAPRARRGARARPRRGAARAGARPPSLPPAGEVAARLRSVGLSARMARRRAEAKGDLKLEVDVDPQSFL